VARVASVVVAVPTRNRPGVLAASLAALERARRHQSFRVLVADSTADAGVAAEVADVCRRYDWVDLRTHSLPNVASARNFCVQQCDAELVITLDDDISVEEMAIARLVEAYAAGEGDRVVAGRVVWPSGSSAPVVMRAIGAGRWAAPGEEPSFLISGFLLYPRRIALAWPWNERLPVGEDVFQGAVWRSRGVTMLFEPDARGEHDGESADYGLREQASLVYRNLFDALLGEPSVRRLLGYEILGFAAAGRAFGIRRRSPRAFLREWWRGHRWFVRDLAYLRHLARSPGSSQMDR